MVPRTQDVEGSAAVGIDPAALTLIDTDVHPAFRGDWYEDLGPYVPDGWRRRFTALANDDPSFAILPRRPFVPKGGGQMRVDLIDADGRPPCSDPAVAAADVFDRGGADFAVMVPQSLLGLGCLPNTDAPAVIAAATNDWQADLWLADDERWLATVVVAPQDPEHGAREIERWGGHPGFAGVFLPFAQPMLGTRHYNPIYEAAEHYGLPILLHPSATEGFFTSAASGAGGLPAYQLDFRMYYRQPYHMALANLIAHGVFERYPKMKVLIQEVGIAWLPDLMWTLDAYWRGAREETPWVRRAPTEYIKDHVRVTTQPFIEPPDKKQLHAMLEMIDAKSTLVFSSDYPHWDADEPHLLERELPEEMRRAIMVENAFELFRPKLQAR